MTKTFRLGWFGVDWWVGWVLPEQLKTLCVWYYIASVQSTPPDTTIQRKDARQGVRTKWQERSEGERNFNFPQQLLFRDAMRVFRLFLILKTQQSTLQY